MTETVRVRLRKPGRVFTFLCRNIPLKRNETCVVRTDRGLEYGVSVLPSEPCSPEDEKRLKMTVVRRATHHDDTTYNQIKIDEERAVQMCRKKVRDRKLPMKLVECEYSFDRKKIIFYFTADDRVDFRELVRDLAQELKARIELRHIQVRDEAKLVGGIGTCGRELCCTTWMSEFMPISMKMAKRQNLSLNPSKISGQCGRLMCCLSYENELYSRAKKSAPRRESRPPREDAAAIRTDMEARPAEAAQVLKDATPKDTPKDEAKTEERPRRAPGRPSRRDRGPRRGGRSGPEAPRKDAAAPGPAPAPAEVGDAGAKETSTDASTDAPKSDEQRSGRRRRRRRKKTRGGEKQDNDSS